MRTAHEKCLFLLNCLFDWPDIGGDSCGLPMNLIKAQMNVILAQPEHVSHSSACFFTWTD